VTIEVRCQARAQPTVKNKSQKHGAIFVGEKRPSKHHHLTAFHHKLTTKAPRSARTFSQNPQQKAHFTTQKKSAPQIAV
jgi:hypothetical protein